MNTINETTIRIDSFGLTPIMNFDRDYNQDWLAPDEGDIDYAVEVEQEIRQFRAIYDFAEEKLLRQGPPVIEKTVEPAGREESLLENDLDLLTLDLGDLADEYHQAVDGQKDAADIALQEEDILGDLDLLGLYDNEEPPFAPEDEIAIVEPKEDEDEFTEPDEGEDDIDSADDVFEADDVDHLESLFDENDEDENGFWNVGAVAPEADITEEIAVDWFGVGSENDEFFEDIEPDVAYDVDVESGVSLEQRALQAAISTGLRFQLDNDDVRMLAEIYLVNGWAACRVAIERELDSGTEIEELELAAATKELWLEHYEFYAGLTSNYRIMSWPTALAIVRSFDGYPSLEEIELLLEQLYEHWYDDSIARTIHRSFGLYIIAWFRHSNEHGPFGGEWNLRLSSSFDEESLLPPSACDIPMNIGHTGKRVFHVDARNKAIA